MKPLVRLLVNGSPPPESGQKPASLTGKSLDGLSLSLQRVAKVFGGFFPIIAA
jgi:hypothetical protein